MGVCSSSANIGDNNDNNTVILSDKTIVRHCDFEIFKNMSHSYDPLGPIFTNLQLSPLICNLQIPMNVISIILSCIQYEEKTINDLIYNKTITSSPTNDFSECCLLIQPPSKTNNISYFISSIYLKCGYFEVIPKSEWPNNAKIYFQIELFDGTNHLNEKAINNSKYNVLWKSKVYECGKSKQLIKVKKINLKLQKNKTYLIWVEVIKPPFHALYGYYDPFFEKDKKKEIYKEKNLKFVREVKLCDNQWFLRNVSKLWEIRFNARVNSN